MAVGSYCSKICLCIYIQSKFLLSRLSSTSAGILFFCHDYAKLNRCIACYWNYNIGIQILLILFWVQIWKLEIDHIKIMKYRPILYRLMMRYNLTIDFKFDSTWFSFKIVIRHSRQINIFPIFNRGRKLSTYNEF